MATSAMGGSDGVTFKDLCGKTQAGGSSWDQYDLFRVINAGRIIVSLREGYQAKEATFYIALEEQLSKDWLRKDDISCRGVELKIGDHVMVESKELRGFKRGILLDQITMMMDKQFTVFLYDYGIFEDVKENQLAAIRPNRVLELPARALIVQLLGIVPVKVVVDLAKKMTGHFKSSHILTQGTEWSRMTSDLVKDWLQSDSVKFLLVATAKTNLDGTVYGDILRMTRGASAESLTEWLLSNQLALANESLRKMQLRIVDAQKSEEEEEQQKLVAVEKKKVRPCSSKSPQGSHFSRTATKALPCKQLVSELKDPLNTNLGRERVGVVDSAKDIDSDSSHSTTSSNSSGKRSAFTVNVDARSNLPGRVLVRGGNARPPFNKLEEMALPQKIVQAMKTLGIEDLSDFQKTVAPNFLRGMDLIMVAPDGGGQYGKNGRLLAYILPILKLVFNKYQKMDPAFVEKCSPEAIIVVDSFNTGMNFEHFINSLLSYCPEVPLKVKFLCKDIPTDANNARSRTQRTQYESKMMPEGISILITTVDYLDALLQTRHGAFLCSNLIYVIFEELENYLKKFWEQIRLFIRCLRESVDCTKRQPFQLAFSASRWSQEMEQLYRQMFQERVSTIVIGAVNQVLRYVKVKWIVHHIEIEGEGQDALDKAKMQTLCELVRSDPSPKTVVACSSPEVAQAIYDGLMEEMNGVAQQITSESSLEEQQFATRLWKSNKLSVIIISDDMINFYDLTDATRLIAYDSPIPPQVVKGQKRAVAAERFGYLWSKIRQIEEDHQERQEGDSSHFIPKLSQPTLVAHFLMTGKEYNFYPMYRFASGLEDATFPPTLKELAVHMEREGVVGQKLCEGVNLFGFCNRRNTECCLARHDFTRKELDAQPILAPSGEVEVCVKKCLSPSEYQVQLLRHFEFKKGQRIQSKSYLVELSHRHQEIERCLEVYGGKKEAVESWEEGTFCAVFHPVEKAYTRARIVTAVRMRPEEKPRQCRVFCVDVGDHLNPRGEAVYKLLSDYEKWEPLVANLVLCNLKPPRGELEWRSYVEKQIREMLVGKVFQAKIWFAIGDTAWVNPLVEYLTDPDTQLQMKGMSARLELIGRKLAVNNSAHLDNLTILLKRHGNLYRGLSALPQKEEKIHLGDFKSWLLPSLREKAEKEFFRLGDDFRWAFVEKSGEQGSVKPAEISVMFGYDPWMFFGVQRKFLVELRMLEKELHKAIERCIGTEEGEGEMVSRVAWDSDDEGDEDFNIFPDYETTFKYFYEPKLVVAVKQRQYQMWMRGIIVDRYEEGGEPLFDVFLVDFGDTMEEVTSKELFPLPTKFVNRMPFQIVAFRLDHIQPNKGEDGVWKEKTNAAFLDLILPDERSEVLEVVTLDDVNVNKNKREWDPDFDPTYEVPCRYYCAVAIDKPGEDLGATLVTRNVASWMSGKEELVAQTKSRLAAFYSRDVMKNLEDDDRPFNGRNSYVQKGNGEVIDLDPADYDVNLDMNATNSFMQNLSIQPKPVIGKDKEVEVKRDSIQTAPAPLAASASNHCQAPKERPNIIDGERYLHPDVVWRQTDTNLILTVLLPDIKTYNCKVGIDGRFIKFRTSGMAQGEYGFHIQFFGKVLREFETYLTGQFLRITFTKRMSGANWIRVLFDKSVKNRFIKEDITYLECDEEEDEEEMAGATANRNLRKALSAKGEDDDGNGSDSSLDIEEKIALMKRKVGKDYDDDDDDDDGGSDEENDDPDNRHKDEMLNGKLDLGDGRFLG